MGTITKALDLLGFFSVTRAEIGLSEFVRLAARDKATVHRHLSELQENGFLEQHPETRAYRLGPALLRLAAVREGAFPMRALLRPLVKELSETVGELAHASLLEAERLSPIVHADPKLHGTQVHFDESELLPLHATSSGLAVLAFGPDTLRTRVLSRPMSVHTGKTIVDPARLQTLIDQARARGISQLDGTFDAEVASQGAPLFGAGGHLVGAISVAVPSQRADTARQRAIAAHLLTAARAASLSLGARDGDLPDVLRQPPTPTAQHKEVTG